MKKRVLILLAAALLLSLAACGEMEESPELPDGVSIVLSDGGVTVDGAPISRNEDAGVYEAHDIIFYLEGQGFTYGEGTAADEHSQAEADAHTVVHIAAPGTYILSGSLSLGQIAVDLGEDAATDPEAVVNLYLNGVDITCTAAPAVIFYNVYECGPDTGETYEIDTSAAGANVTIVDGTVNNINGSYVARIYKSIELNKDGTKVKKYKTLHKYDGALYSKMSMNVNGDTGVLNITAENEGLDSELHLTVNGGVINITAGNDGINTNEDNVSVTTINGGELNITVTGSTGEGDGIDSNGWIVINGGTINAFACATSVDSGIDSDLGIYLNGGTIAATGNMLDTIAGGRQSHVVFTLSNGDFGGGTYVLRDGSGKEVMTASPVNAFTFLLLSAPGITEGGTYTLWAGDVLLATSTASTVTDRNPGGMSGPGGGLEPPESDQFPEGTEPPEGGQPPEGTEPPEGGRLPGDTEPSESPEIDRLPGVTTPQPPEGGSADDPPFMELPENELPVEPKPPLLPEGTGGTAAV